MSFYEEWEKVYSIEKSSNLYFDEFLNLSQDSLKLFLEGPDDKLVQMVRFLVNIPIKEFILRINSSKDYSARDIVQFSNLDNAIMGVSSALKLKKVSLSFLEIGRILFFNKSDVACKKYGENHSKLARELSMVTFERKRDVKISNTPFGVFSLSLDNDDKIQVVRRLLLRNPFIQTFIYNARNGKVKYSDMTKCLAYKTSLRRKSNVKKIINIILEGEECLDNIIWE